MMDKPIASWYLSEFRVKEENKEKECQNWGPANEKAHCQELIMCFVNLALIRNIFSVKQEGRTM